MSNFFERSFSQNPAGALEKAFVSRVFSYLTGALAITGVTAYAFGTSPELLANLVDPETFRPTMLGWIVTFAPFAFVLFIGRMVRTMAPSQLLLALIAFSAVMGMSLSYIFLVYTGASITKVFFITSGTFGIMALLGYTTQTDLTRFGSILRMALIGIIIAMIVNFFMQSAAFDYLISALGVLIFTGLTAYDMQMIRRNAQQMMSTGEAMASKLAMFSALSLYLDFINLFLFLLRLFGSRD